jgi:hypothetical protein
MTTTIEAAALTVTINESVVLNGRQQGAVNSATISSVNEVSKRIVTITPTEATIATFSTAAANGTYIILNVRYMRFTNLDDANFITLTFTNQDSDEVAIKLDAGRSFIWNGDNNGGLSNIMNATEAAGVAATLADLANIQADADSDNCDLEMFIASV